jgi:limonene-1,2-epoxide hydrolase
MTSATTSGDAKAVLSAWLETMDETQNPDLALERYTDPCELIGPGGAAARTPREVRDFARGFGNALSEIRHEVTNWVACGDRVAMEFTLTGVNTGPFATPKGEIAPTGKTIRLRCAGLYRVVGDRITEAHLYFDQLELMTQLGLM